MDARSSSASDVKHNVLLDFFAEGSESDASRSTVAWKGGAHPSLAGTGIPEGVPTPNDRVQIECIQWEDTKDVPGEDGPRHVRYIVKVTAPGLDPYLLRKRWGEVSELSKSLYKYERFLPGECWWQANGEKPLPTKLTSAGYDKGRLEGRRVEINAFLEDLSAWMNRLLEPSTSPKTGPVDLLKLPASGGLRVDLLAKFFEQDAAYDRAKETVRDFRPVGGR